MTRPIHAGLGCLLLSVATVALAADPYGSPNPGGPYEVGEGGTVTLDGSGSGKGSCSGLGKQVSYAWDLDDDGNVDTSYKNPPEAAIFSAADLDGPTTARVGLVARCEITLAASTYKTVKADVTIHNVPPSVGAIQGPASAAEGQLVNFTSDVQDIAPADTVTTEWSWGDGSSDAGKRTGSSTTDKAAHTWLDNGTYTITLGATDDDHGYTETSFEITITNAPPAITDMQVPKNARPATSVQMSASAIDPGVSDTLTYLWDFGDGDAATGTNVTHTYTEEREYTVLLMVRDNEGATDSLSKKINIGPFDDTDASETDTGAPSDTDWVYPPDPGDTEGPTSDSQTPGGEAPFPGDDIAFGPTADGCACQHGSSTLPTSGALLVGLIAGLRRRKRA